MKIMKQTSGLNLGQPRFPAIRPIALPDVDLVRNVLISSSDEDLRRKHTRALLSQQACRGGDWLYLTCADDRYGVERLKEHARLAGRADGLDIITLDPSAPGLVYSHDDQGCVARPGRLCCVLLPPAYRLRKGGAVLLGKLLRDLAVEVTARMKASPAPTAVPYLIALDDIAQLEAMMELPVQPGDCFRPLISMVEQSRGSGIGFLLGARSWGPGAGSLADTLYANSSNWIVHAGVSQGDAHYLSQRAGSDLSGKLNDLLQDRFVFLHDPVPRLNSAGCKVLSGRFPRPLAGADA